MPFLHLRLSVPECVPGTLLWPQFGYVVDCTHFQPSTMQSVFRVSVVNNPLPALGFSSSFSRLHPLGALQMSVSAGEAVDSESQRGESILGADSWRQHNLNGEVQLDSVSDSSAVNINENGKEVQRRRKIGLANKGRVPWNKGRKHSAETREKIRQKTIEALRDPKVRQKMSECPRVHSEQVKAKIRSSICRVWAERLKWKRSREKFYLSWAESIAMAAKKGGSDQQELDWDSYNRMKEEIALQQIQWAENKKRAKEHAKMRAERAARARAEKMAMLAEKRRERQRRAEARGELKKKTIRKSKEDKEELEIAKGLKLKERLTKLHKKKSVIGQIASHRDMLISDIPAREELDLEFIKKERMQREVSLADQIRAAKSKRAQSAAREALSKRSIERSTRMFPSYSFSERSTVTSLGSTTLQEWESS